MSQRTTRSQTRAVDSKPPSPGPAELVTTVDLLHLSPDIEHLPDKLATQLTGLCSKELRLLQLKQRKLRDHDGQIPTFLRSSDNARLRTAAASTLVFAQEEAGTAVCVSSGGLLLTCSHCIADSLADLDREKVHCLLFADGRAVKARYLAWDEKRDLALLQIVAAQGSMDDGLPFISLASGPPKRNANLTCVGHPGSEDFEVDEAGVKTGYDVLHVSEGKFRGLAKGQDVHDNSEIGALKHDCWTYWGHSGAPLANNEGMLVGLHSSWDDETGMRRGVAWEAVKAFLEEHEAAI